MTQFPTDGAFEFAILGRGNVHADDILTGTVTNLALVRTLASSMSATGPTSRWRTPPAPRHERIYLVALGEVEPFDEEPEHLPRLFL